MESITIKVDKNMGKMIDQAMKSGYSTKTEFIREAIRDKSDKINKDRLMKEFMKFYGRSKKKVSDKRLREIREQVGQKYAKKYGIDLD